MDTLPIRRRYLPAAGLKRANVPTHCRVHGCGRRCHHYGSGTCSRHATQLQRHGHVEATAITHAELWYFADYINNGLLRFDQTVAYREALRRCQQLLNFYATTSEPWQRYLQERVLAIRHKKGVVVTPRDVLTAVLCLVAYSQANPHRLPNTDAYLIALQRAVVNIGRVGRAKRPTKREQIGAGRYIAELLGKFAVLFLQKWGDTHRRETLKRQREEAALTDFGQDDLRIQ